MRWPMRIAAMALAGTAAAASLEGEIGARLFRRAWVPAPASTGADDGLGPLYNARSCQACHAGLARARVDAADPLAAGVVIRLGDAAGLGDPAYGAQLQTQALPGVVPEPPATVAWQDDSGLRRPVISLFPRPGNPAPIASAGLRAAPALARSGDIAAVPDAAIVDAAAQSVTQGRVARLPDGRIGRFGWKAVTATLEDATALAFSRDLGLSTVQIPDAAGDCTPAQTTCRAAPGGRPMTRPEMAPDMISLLAALLSEQRTPAPPAEPPPVYAEAGCAGCHRPRLAGVVLYSDLLLHDMGADLADGIAEGAAGPAEWRTAPLAGLGIAEAAGLLHDGRARSIDEAIRWHGGAASASRLRYLALPAADRAALLAFLRTL